MIAVIADDFTGAAELGGIGLRYGLQVEVSTEVNTKSTADLLVIDADSRSVNEEAAVEKIKKITSELKRLQPEWIYKKTDSVLRGHVSAELKAQMSVAGIDRALLVPANPYLGRTIKNGMYYLNGQPVHQSSFSIDPEFAITSPDIQHMLKTKNDPVHLVKPNETLPALGIMVGEATEMKDLDFWAGQWTKDILPAGAAGFFTALLDRQKEKVARLKDVEAMSMAYLYVCGTTFEQSTRSIKEIELAGGSVSYMQDDVGTWSKQTTALLNRYGKAIIAIDPEKEYANAAALREKTAAVVKEVLKQVRVQELLIEGGSTARAIFDRLGFTHFFPVQELSAGVVRMRSKEQKGIFITVKPGSYAWPPGTWKF
jgi:uncharacterized protein YgbK (DUF1537 family)